MLDQQDIQIISDLLDQKLDKKLEENNKIVVGEITSRVADEVTSKVADEVTSKVADEVTSKVADEVTSKVADEVTSKVVGGVTAKIDELALTIKQSFNEVEDRIDRLEERMNEFGEELGKKPSTADLFAWSDNIVMPISLDVDRLKFLNRDKWKKLPSQPEITQALVDADIK